MVKIFIIRLQITSNGKGKSGGARVVTHLNISFLKDAFKLAIVYLATIYDKAEMDTISEKELKLVLKEIKEEFN